MKINARGKDVSGRKYRMAISSLAALLLTTSCSGSRKDVDSGTESNPPPYIIGLGEIMGLSQMRHAKLWYAGQAGNWPLAAYEIDELKEGFADATLYHNRHKSVPRPLDDMIPEYLDRPMADLQAAVRRSDKRAFAHAFEALTQGCNSCHREAGFGFNVVAKPTSLPVSNQSFAPMAASQ